MAEKKIARMKTSMLNSIVKRERLKPDESRGGGQRYGGPRDAATSKESLERKIMAETKSAATRKNIAALGAGAGTDALDNDWQRPHS